MLVSDLYSYGLSKRYDPLLRLERCVLMSNSKELKSISRACRNFLKSRKAPCPKLSQEEKAYILSSFTLLCPERFDIETFDYIKKKYGYQKKEVKALAPESLFQVVWNLKMDSSNFLKLNQALDDILDSLALDICVLEVFHETK